MKKVLIIFMIIALVGCATDYKISRLKKDMSEDRAASIMGKPDRVEKRGEYVVFRYKDRLTAGYPSERADYYVIARNGLVVDYGIGRSRLELPSPEEKCNSRLGTIGVVSALFLPEAEIHAPSWEKEAERGAGKGADAGLGAPCPVCIVTVPVGAFIGCLVGIPQGLKQDVPDDEVEEMRGVITNAIPKLKVQETISTYVLKSALELTDCDFDLLKGRGPASPDEEINYSFLKGDGIDHVLEISVRSVGFKSGPGSNPDIFFFMTVHYRFIRVANNKEILSKDIVIGERWISDKLLKLADYMEDESRLLREEFEYSCRDAGEKIATKLLYE